MGPPYRAAQPVQSDFRDQDSVNDNRVVLWADADGFFRVDGKVNGRLVNFLIDTGASLSTISRSLFEKIKSHRDVIHVRKIAARLANGKFQSAEVYRISNFVIGKQCKMAPLEVAVMPSNGRNILGMNALAMTAPFGLNPQKMALAVSRCQSPVLDMSGFRFKGRSIV